jgi:hypothetical protein
MDQVTGTSPDDEISATENKVGSGSATPVDATRSLTWPACPDPIPARINLSVRPCLPFSCYDCLGALGPARNTSIAISLTTGVDRMHSFSIKWISVIHVACTSSFRGRPFHTLHTPRLHVAQNEREKIERETRRQSTTKFWMMASSFLSPWGFHRSLAWGGLLGNGFGATLLYWRTCS